jgi:hypothetical protein
MNEPTIDDAFPFLSSITTTPIEDCKAAYDKFDVSSPGYQIDDMRENVLAGGSVRAFIEMRWPHIKTVLDKYPAHHFKDLALAAEYALRQAKT